MQDFTAKTHGLLTSRLPGSIHSNFDGMCISCVLSGFRQYRDRYSKHLPWGTDKRITVKLSVMRRLLLFVLHACKRCQRPMQPIQDSKLFARHIHGNVYWQLASDIICFACTVPKGKKLSKSFNQVNHKHVTTTHRWRGLCQPQAVVTTMCVATDQGHPDQV